MTKRTLFHILLVVTIITLPAVALADDHEFKQYSVIKGDTLWSISGKELSDPFLWPKIWKENPDIKNPDRLYPGQTVRIPLSLLQKERAEEVSGARQESPLQPTPTSAKAEALTKKGPASIELKPLISNSALMASGYISDTISSAGAIAGTASDRNIFGNNDIVYVKMKQPAKIGDRFYIFRANNPVHHPLTGRYLGYEVEMLGIAEITQFEYGETKAVITQIFSDVNTGDLLQPFYEMTPPLTSGNHRKPHMDATVLAVKSLHLLGGNLDIAYIDKGERDGIDVGDMFRTVNIGTHKAPNGVIQIIYTRDTTSTAIIREFTDSITAGNLVTHLE